MEFTFWVMLYLPTKFELATSWNGRDIEIDIDIDKYIDIDIDL